MRVLDATITCLGRWGLAKTTLDDIARQAGVSRATVYRLFPGGKDTVVAAAVTGELERFLAGLADELDRAASLEDTLVAALTHVTRAVRQHATFAFLLEHEPDQVMPHVAFDGLDRVLRFAADWSAPWFTPHVGDDLAHRAGEWVARMIVSYVFSPSDRFDLGDDRDARRFAQLFLIPGLSKGALT